MKTCFVIQPFDGGEFDERYKDIYEPAIISAGLLPYRVDQDKAVQIPINTIEEKIKDAAICLADISLDNPNVMFELGYSLALDKDVVLICKEDLRTKFPFDIRHRQIIKYKTASPTAFEKLRNDIVSTLKARMEKQEKFAGATMRLPIKQIGSELSQYEEVALISIFENLYPSNDSEGVLDNQIESDMSSLGFNKLAKNFSLMKLQTNGYITSDTFHHEGDSYIGYFLTKKGADWFIANEKKLEFRTKPNPKSEPEITHVERLGVASEDIPF